MFVNVDYFKANTVMLNDVKKTVCAHVGIGGGAGQAGTCDEQVQRTTAYLEGYGGKVIMGGLSFATLPRAYLRVHRSLCNGVGEAKPKWFEVPKAMCTGRQAMGDSLVFDSGHYHYTCEIRVNLDTGKVEDAMSAFGKINKNNRMEVFHIHRYVPGTDTHELL